MVFGASLTAGGDKASRPTAGARIWTNCASSMLGFDVDPGADGAAVCRMEPTSASTGDDDEIAGRKMKS